MKNKKHMLLLAIIASLGIHASVFMAPFFNQAIQSEFSTSISVRLEENSEQAEPSNKEDEDEEKKNVESTGNDIKTEAQLEGSLRIVYPKRSRALYEEGSVELEFIVDSKGQALNITIVSSSGYERLDQAAMESLKEANFHPSTINGKVTESKRRMTVDFQLKDKN